MDDDKFALVEKIIIDIDNVLSKNAELCAFDIVPVECNYRNKSPVLHLENCLGLESWCVKHVYIYCYNELMDKFFAKPKRKPSKPFTLNSDRLAKLLNVTLLINPELTTLWNKRREMIQNNLTERSSELLFTKLVLSRKPKCNEAFSYRRWLLQGVFIGELIQANTLENFINEELRICELASDRCPNNYHSWCHRMWVLDTLRNRKHYDIAFLFVKEYGFSERWASKHVSDFSCFHYRQFCIRNVLTVDNASWKSFESTIDKNLRKSLVIALISNFPKDFSASEDSLLSFSEEQLVNLILSHTNRTCSCSSNNVSVCRQIEVLFYELLLNNELLRFYKHHETLWYHRRFVVHELICLMYDHFGFVRQNGALIKKTCKKCNNDDRQKQAKIIRYDCNRVYSSVLFNVLISHEKRFVDERRSDGDNYSDRHEKYMKFVEGLNNVMYVSLFKNHTFIYNE